MSEIARLKTTSTKADAMPVKVDAKKIIITPPVWARATVTLRGTAPYVQNRFSSENKAKMEEKQKEGSSLGKGRRAKPPKDFNKVYEGSLHVSQEGWYGIPATALRWAMIDACRVTEFDMTRAKMVLRIIADGLDRDNLEPLVKIDGKPRMFIDRVKIGMNQTDLAARGIFEQWSARVTVEWDSDVFQAQDVFNLLARAGWQVGIGAGRPFSKSSPGTGKGTWEVEAG
jgi:hypothetical protein